VCVFELFLNFFSPLLQKFKHTSFSPLSALRCKKTRSFCVLYLLRVHINIAENARTKIHTTTSVPCVHFQFSFHRDGEVTHMH
jgi:hypothetical protein